MRRILITGAGGQLGADLAERAQRRGMPVVALRRTACDITDRCAVARELEMHQPDVLVNCAAWTDVDGAEAHPAAAFTANATGPRVLAFECAARDVLLVQLSTDYVFDGASALPIAEDAPPSPLSVYGATKLAGEREVRVHARRHLIVRTSGLYGRDGPNFVLKVLQRAADGAEVRVVSDQLTSPTWTGHLADALLRLIERGAAGTYHLTNSGGISWHEFATSALDLAGYRCGVRPITTSELASAARRPMRALLDNRAWRALGERPLPHWHDALAAYIAGVRALGQLRAGDGVRRTSRRDRPRTEALEASEGLSPHSR